jgi:Helicase HerA, central domain
MLRLEGSPAATSPGPDCVQLVEIITPRTNTAALSAADHLFATLVGSSGLGLELAGDAAGRHLYARADPALASRFALQLGAAYPQAHIRRVGGVDDPARLRSGEQVAACTLQLAEPEYLPLRVARDAELAAPRAPQADPFLAVLAALGDVPPGWRALVQLVLWAAPADWARPHLRRSLEHALAPERAAEYGGRSYGWGGLVGAVLLLGAVVLGPRLALANRSGDWLHLILPVGGITLAMLVAGVVWRRLNRRPLYDLALVQEKLSRPAARVELRLVVFAPADAEPLVVAGRLRDLAAAYRAYDLDRGNRLVARHFRVPPAPDALCAPRPLGGTHRLATLGTRELAALWHPVQAGDDVALVERTAARRFLPLPATVADGARVGVSEDGLGRRVQVHLAPALLRRHALLVAKTRKGKSALLRTLWQQLIALETDRRPAVVLIDPHSDLAAAALGAVPTARHGDVVYLDVARTDRPFGLNLLDVGLGWPRDRIVSNALRVFEMEFDHFWGPRMELVFRFALLLLVEANQRLVAADPTGGRDRQWTILEVPRVLEDAAFRRALLADVRDRQVLDWWRTFYDMLDRRFQLEIINPVQTKTYKPAANLTARAIVGQSRSTIDPWTWVRDGALVVVDVAKEQVGADIAALLGGTLANLVALAIGRQSALPPSRRRHVALLVDEFHALPAADYGALLAELAKYGASLTLATQTLGALVGPSGDRHLLDAVFGNTDHLFAFNCAATDAKVLAPELGAPLEPADLVELGDFQCYARLSHRGERLPAFSLRLDPPPPGDPVVQDVLAASSAARYGRAAAAVAADREALLERIAQLSRRPAPLASSGEAIDDPDKGALPVRRQARAGRRGRSQSRPPKPSKGPDAGGADAVQLELEEREAPVAIEHASEHVP